MTRDNKADNMQQELIRKGWMNTKDFKMIANADGSIPDLYFRSPLGYEVSMPINGIHTVIYPNGTRVKMTTAELDANNIKRTS
jgi:hypothetical protein